MKLLTITAFFYVAGVVITFGHASNNIPACLKLEREFDKTDCHVVSGALASMFWPLYWSHQAFK